MNLAHITMDKQKGRKRWFYGEDSDGIMSIMNRVRLLSKNEEDGDFTVEFCLSDFHSLEISVNGR